MAGGFILGQIPERGKTGLPKKFVRCTEGKGGYQSCASQSQGCQGKNGVQSRSGQGNPRCDRKTVRERGACEGGPGVTWKSASRSRELRLIVGRSVLPWSSSASRRKRIDRSERKEPQKKNSGKGSRKKREGGPGREALADSSRTFSRKGHEGKGRRDLLRP